MIETNQNKDLAPKVGLVVEPGNLWSEFQSFGKTSKIDSATASERLAHYQHFMQVVSAFFSQPGIVDNPTPETKGLVGKLFYQHENNTPDPVDFFIQAAERLTDEVLNKGHVKPGTSRWKEEVSFIKDLSEQELYLTTLYLRDETACRERLVQLADNDSSKVLDTALQMEINSKEQLRQKTQERAISLLAQQDPNLASDVSKRDAFIKTLDTLSVNYDPSQIQVALSEYKTFLENPDGTSALDEIKRRLFLKQHKNVKDILKDLGEEARKPKFIWKQWVEKGIIPAALLNSFEEIVTLSELADCAQVLSECPKEVRAKNLVPFLRKGISASMLTEIAEGRFEFSEDFITAQIDAFMHFNDVSQVEATKSHKLRTLTGVLVVATLVTIAATQFRNDESALNKAKIDDIIQSIPTSTSTPIPTFTPTATETPQPKPTFTSTPTKTPTPEMLIGKAIRVANNDENVDTGTIGAQLSQDIQVLQAQASEFSIPKGSFSQSENTEVSDEETKPQTTSPSVAESASVLNSGIEQPSNSSAEEFLQALQTEVWHIEGKGIAGHYRISTASYFMPTRRLWIDRNIANINKTTLFASQKDITISRNSEKITSQVLNLPIKGDFAVSEDGVKIKGDISSFKVLQRADGTYFVYFTDKTDIGKTISISVDLGKIGRVENLVIPPPNQEELQDMTQIFINPYDLRDDMRKVVVSTFNNNQLSKLQKAQILENYIQQNFQYSLDTKWNDYYHQAKDAKTFFERIAEIRKTDCDVANTALVFLLRYQNIPARMAFGFANGGSDQLTKGQYHGWVEAYIDGNWVTFDATPFNKDEFTEKALKDKLPPGRVLPSEIVGDIEGKDFDQQAWPTNASATITQPPPAFNSESGRFRPYSEPRRRTHIPEVWENTLNRSVENVEADRNRGVWGVLNMFGDQPKRGYYRTATSSYLEKRNQTWEVNKNLHNIWTDPYPSGSFDIGNRLFRTITIKGYDQVIELPLDDDNLLTDNIFVDYYSIDSNKIIGSIVPTRSIFRNVDGTYFLMHLPEEYHGKEVQIQVNFRPRKFEANRGGPSIPPPSDIEMATLLLHQLIGPGGLIDMPLKMGTIKTAENTLNLPNDVQSFLQDLNSKDNLSNKDLARILEKYIQTTFLYSLNPRWSDFYHEAKDQSSFIKRIFEIKKADSTVANTALIALLRSQNIPSRMAFGYVHNNDTEGFEVSYITAAERRGWVEAYVNGEWLTLDATPIQPDAYTLKSTNKSPAKQENDNESIAALLYSIRGNITEYPIEAMLKLLTMVNTLAFGLNAAGRIGNRRLSEKVTSELAKRVEDYTGSSTTRLAKILTQKEHSSIYEATHGNPLPNVFTLIPPLAIINRVHTIAKIRELEELPYAKGTRNVDKASNPDAAEFLIDVLGYDETEIKKRIQEKALSEIIGQLKSALNNEIDNSFRTYQYQNTREEKVNRKYSDLAFDTVYAVALPDTESEWEQKIGEAKEKFYLEYARGYAKLKKQKSKDPLPDPLTKNEVFQSFDKAFKLRAAVLLAEKAFQASL